MARTIIRLPCLTRLLVRFDYCQSPADGDVPNGRGKLISNARAPPHGRAAATPFRYQTLIDYPSPVSLAHYPSPNAAGQAGR